MGILHTRFRIVRHRIQLGSFQLFPADRIILFGEILLWHPIFALLDLIHGALPRWIDLGIAVPAFAITGANIQCEDPLMSSVFCWQESESHGSQQLTFACPNCECSLALYQPDPDLPHRLLATCNECKSWYLANPRGLASAAFPALLDHRKTAGLTGRLAERLAEGRSN